MNNKKTVVKFDDEYFEIIKNLAIEEGITVPAFLDRAVKAEKFLFTQRNQGNKILIEKPNGEINEVVLQ